MPTSQLPLFAGEDCNLPIQERIELLDLLQTSVGDITPHLGQHDICVTFES